MLPSLSELELSRLHRRPARVYELLFNPREIDLSRLKGLAYEDAIARVAGIPAAQLGMVSLERARQIAEIQLRYQERNAI